MPRAFNKAGFFGKPGRESISTAPTSLAVGVSVGRYALDQNWSIKPFNVEQDHDGNWNGNLFAQSHEQLENINGRCVVSHIQHQDENGAKMNNGRHPIAGIILTGMHAPFLLISDSAPRHLKNGQVNLGNNSGFASKVSRNDTNSDWDVIAPVCSLRQSEDNQPVVSVFGENEGDPIPKFSDIGADPMPARMSARVGKTSAILVDGPCRIAEAVFDWRLDDPVADSRQGVSDQAGGDKAFCAENLTAEAPPKRYSAGHHKTFLKLSAARCMPRSCTQASTPDLDQSAVQRVRASARCRPGPTKFPSIHLYLPE